MIALAGYLVMQIGLWHAENKWDEEGSAAWLEAAGGNKSQAPEELEANFGSEGSSAMAVQSEEVSTPRTVDPLLQSDVVIPDDKLKAAFPIPWGFLCGWWLWGSSYMFPLDGSTRVAPTSFGIAACVICVFVSIVASVPMSDAVMNRKGQQKMVLSLLFLIGWIALGIVSSLDITTQVGKIDNWTKACIWILCMLGPITIIVSQKILFGARKMGTLWEESGKPNFHPIVYNMGGPLFVWGWFMLWLGISGLPGVADPSDIYEADISIPYVPLFLNWRTLISFCFGCGMVPVVRFLDYSHDEDGKWLGENSEGNVFSRWWLGTDGTYFGVFLESPWPFVIFWTMYGFSSMITFDNQIHAGAREIALLANCILQGLDAGILIQQNLYAGNAHGKQMFSLPFVILFMALAINIGSRWNWLALALSLPGAILIILGQKTVFGARKRGDYTMQNNGKANPYDQVFVYSWGEVFFMMGWILICWGEAMPQ
eukprot:TRINITY_DN10522_c0_g1_i2.p1 TRINITY_DN10522_c0_g1~~TRINITY_DN10522_c0_g1_i2.p1  ORF type:complete len:519 (+),score=90.15 TRINITY_DN10522_c0_g1_i2:107-1558(+)